MRQGKQLNLDAVDDHNRTVRCSLGPASFCALGPANAAVRNVAADAMFRPPCELQNQNTVVDCLFFGVLACNQALMFALRGGGDRAARSLIAGMNPPSCRASLAGPA
jgi:hypothetical protein